MGTGLHTHIGTQKCQGQGSPLTCKIHWENISPTVTLFLPQPKKAGFDSHDPLNRTTSEKSNLHPSSRCGSLRVPEPQKVPPAQGTLPHSDIRRSSLDPDPPAQPHTQGGSATGHLVSTCHWQRWNSRGRGQRGGGPTRVIPNPGTDCSTFRRKVSLESQPDLDRKCERGGNHSGRDRQEQGQLHSWSFLWPKVWPRGRKRAILQQAPGSSRDIRSHSTETGSLCA